MIFGTFVSTLSMQSGAPTFGTPEAALAIYGAGGLLAPFIGIKAIDLAVSALHLA